MQTMRFCSFSDLHGFHQPRAADKGKKENNHGKLKNITMQKNNLVAPEQQGDVNSAIS